MADSQQKFNQLVDVMRKLRAPDGCPWDQEQTHESLLPHLIEETYEVAEAIQSKQLDDLRKELGDLLLQVVFHSILAEEEKRFSIDDVVQALHDKLVHRHPHVFGDAKGINTAEDVKKVWSKQKKKEGKKSVLGGVPSAMPAMQRAWRLSDKASTVGFDWPNIDAVWEKFDEELSELREAISSKELSAIEHEFGDLLFALINLSRFLKVDPEVALQRTNSRFVKRFQKMEEIAEKNDQALTDMTLDDQEKLYQQAKQLLAL